VKQEWTAPLTKRSVVQSADVFPAGRGLERLLARQEAARSTGLAALFEATGARIDQAFERISSVERRLRRLEIGARETPARELEYLVFSSVPSGYRLAIAFGRLPEPGDQIAAPGDGSVEVLRIGASPLPGDRRPCVFAGAVAVGSPDVAEAEATFDRRAA
jgi:hypothetical protein